jgi:hypothetical protein
MKTQTLTHHRLVELIAYEPTTGVFIARCRRPHSALKVGDVLGTPRKRDGYHIIGIDKVTHQAHRLAWFYVYGSWPLNQIDHINGEKSDNRIANLRDVNSSMNMQNQVVGSMKKKVGFLGVSMHKSGKYQASIQLAGRPSYLGLYDSPEEAHTVYLTKKREIHPGFVETRL